MTIYSINIPTAQRHVIFRVLDLLHNTSRIGSVVFGETSIYDVYRSPLESRYACAKMKNNFSEKRKAIVWRQLWVALAKAQKELGCQISDLQINELIAHVEEIDFAAVRETEMKVKHDVMAHLLEYARLCPNAGKILHLGCTSSYVHDNGDLIIMRDGLDILFGEGATGTQASYLSLFNNDDEKVQQLDRLVAKLMRFDSLFIICGQTYTRKMDVDIVNMLASFGSTAHKICTDIRLLASFKEVDEPFEKSQVGSSAMPYKRNPVRCERVCGLARYLMALAQNALNTHAVQWLERSLDDSVNRRLTLSESFIVASTILNMLWNIFENLTVYPKVIENRVQAELHLLATEEILVAMVNAGGDRNEAHERLRTLYHKYNEEIKAGSSCDDFGNIIKKDDYFSPVFNIIDSIFNPKLLIGRASIQVTEFLSTEVSPFLSQYSMFISNDISQFAV